MFHVKCKVRDNKGGDYLYFVASNDPQQLKCVSNRIGDKRDRVFGGSKHPKGITTKSPRKRGYVTHAYGVCLRKAIAGD